MHAWKGKGGGGKSGWTSEVVADFNESVNAVWEGARSNYSLIARRDLEVLRTLYPPQNERFIRLQLSRDGKPIGWAVLLNTPMQASKYFGNLRVGTVVDCLALPGEEAAVVAACTRELGTRGADLVISNQLHRDWCAAFDGMGYLRGPSNFFFAVAPGLVKRLEPFDTEVHRAHMTRGDGDGPINL
jgi:hypothetical protein